MTPSAKNKNPIERSAQAPIEQSMVERFRQLGLETDVAFILNLLDLYPPMFEKHYSSIKDADARQDVSRLHSATHTLKGASLNIGANQLASVCRRIEDSSHHKDFDTIHTLMGDLRKELQSASTALHLIRTRLSQSKS